MHTRLSTSTERRRSRAGRSNVAVIALVAAGGVAVLASATHPTLSRDAESAAVTREFGESVAVGRGQARVYVDYDRKNGGAPIEIGVALTEGALEGLPGASANAAAAASSEHEHVDNHVYLLQLPVGGAAPFQFVELDWNPGGHEPPGVYDTPHFDFHFYTTSPAVREGIVPTDSAFQRKADMLPPQGDRPQFYAVAAPEGAPAPGVPLMGVHWIDVRSPELQQMFGKPDAYKPFTTTFLYGSWEGRYIFAEPMITRAYILSKKTATDAAQRNEVIPVSMPSSLGAPGWYPGAYRIAWDAEAKEYRIALTQLAKRG